MGEQCLLNRSEHLMCSLFAVEVAGVSKSFLSERAHDLFKRNPPG